MDRRIVDNEGLTEACRSIFGDIITKAYRTPYYVENNYEISPVLNGNIFDYDTDEFIIEFVNGSTVKFTNSEWASLERLDNANLQQT